MTDQPDFELEAASAAADDLASAEERALVDGSPALQAEVASIRELSAEIAAVDVPAGARASAIAAALAVFDDAASTPAAAPATTSRVVPLDFRRRRQWGALVGAAAAAVAVLAVGAVLVTSGGRDDESSDTTSAAAMVTVVPAAERTENEDSAGAPAATTAKDADEADSQPFEDTTSAEAPLPAVAETTAPLIIEAPADVTPAIGSPSELLSYASSPLTFSTPATEASEDQPAETTADTTAGTTAETMAETTAATTPAADTAPPAADAPDTGLATRPLPRDLCVSDGTEYVGQVRYQGVLAYVVRVLDTGEVRALAAVDCRLLASATP